MLASATILQRFCRARGGKIILALEPAYLGLLKQLGEPHKKIPPVIHVAGTNGKGSVCAFLRAMLEAAGCKVHVYTSPHLVRFHERIRVAGELISEEELAEILSHIESLAAPGKVSDFEAGTAAAFVAFARHKADVAILETGMGGRLDATNVIEKPLATVITRLSFDHREYLGDTLTLIAREKAGIMRANAPCFTAMQPAAESLETLRAAANEKSAPLFIGGTNWRVAPCDNGFHFEDSTRTLDLPLPALPGTHQIENACLAIAALSALPEPIPPQAIARGLQTVEWPARLQKITTGALFELLPPGWQLWLDGGHNDSAGAALAAEAARWRAVDHCPLHLVFGMLATKNPPEFLAPLAPFVASLRAVAIPGETPAFVPADLAQAARDAGIADAAASTGVPQALTELATGAPGRILICGSLYLAGHVLRLNGNKAL